MAILGKRPSKAWEEPVRAEARAWWPFLVLGVLELVGTSLFWMCVTQSSDQIFWGLGAGLLSFMLFIGITGILLLCVELERRDVPPRPVVTPKVEKREPAKVISLAEYRARRQSGETPPSSDHPESPRPLSA